MYPQDNDFGNHSNPSNQSENVQYGPGGGTWNGNAGGGPAQPSRPSPAPATPPQPRKRRGCLFWFSMIILFMVVTVFLAGALLDLLIVGLSEATPVLAGTPKQEVREEVISEAETMTSDKIAVIDIKGIIISSPSFETVTPRDVCLELKTAREDPDVKAVILDMNTPGGGITASDEIHRAVQKVRAAGKPVVTCMHSVGASGGYFIAAGTTHIIANRLTLTGSVGVLIGTTNYAKLFEKIGLESEVYTSGDMKDFLNGGRMRTEEEKRYVQALIQTNFEAFAQVIADGREGFDTVSEVLSSEFADGRVLCGQDALELGLIDELGYYDDALERAHELAGISDAAVIRYRRGLHLRDLLFAMQDRLGVSSLLPPESRTIKPGRLYFLLPTIQE